jgi:hypothetical protein
MPDSKAVVDGSRVKEVVLVSELLGVNGERGVEEAAEVGSGGGGVERELEVEGIWERLAKGSSSMRKAGGGELRGDVTKGMAGDLSRRLPSRRRCQ